MSVQILKVIVTSNKTINIQNILKLIYSRGSSMVYFLALIICNCASNNDR